VIGSHGHTDSAQVLDDSISRADTLAMPDRRDRRACPLKDGIRASTGRPVVPETNARPTTSIRSPASAVHPAHRVAILRDRWELPAKLLHACNIASVTAHTEGMWWSFLKAVKTRQHRVAPTTWVAGIAAVVYTVAPIDLIPEIVLGPLGFVDDIGLWSILAILFAREQRRWLAGLAPKQHNIAIAPQPIN